MGKLKLMLHLGKAQRADDTLFLRRLSNRSCMSVQHPKKLSYSLKRPFVGT